MFLDTVVTEFLSKLEARRDDGTIEGKRTFNYMEKSVQLCKKSEGAWIGCTRVALTTSIKDDTI